MANYKVISENCTLGKQGETLNASDLEGFNIDALVDGGHLAEVNVKVSKQDTKESDK